MMHDLPLVIFTILSQLVVGGIITLWWLDRKTKSISRKTGLIASVSLIIIGGISILISLLHLGQPFAAYRAILNFGVSWLSREITFYGVFVGISALYAWFWYKENAEKRNIIGWVGAIIGIIAIFSSAKIYMIPSHPAWNSMSTMFTFFLTCIVLGPLFVGLVLAARKELTMNVSLVSVVGLVVAAIVMIVYFTSLLGGLPQAVETAHLTLTSFLFWIRIATFVIAFAILVFAIKKPRLQNATLYSVTFAILLVSEFIARLQFYITAVHTTVPF